MEVNVLNIKGEDTGRKVTLSESIFGIEPNDHAIYLDVKQYMANQRQGTHKSKERSEISGSTRKLGRRKSALAYKAQTNNIVVVEDFTFESPKTKEFVNVVNNLKVAGKKLLMVLPEANKNVYLSARNIERANVAIASALNTYKVLDAETLVVTESSLKAIENILS